MFRSSAATAPGRSMASCSTRTSSAPPDQESEEVWIFQNSGGGWAHPIHVHFEEHRPLRDNGSRSQMPSAPRSTAPSNMPAATWSPLHGNSEIQVFIRFRDMKGRYVMHCHNVVHEDHAMMVRWDIV